MFFDWHQIEFLLDIIVIILLSRMIFNSSNDVPNFQKIKDTTIMDHHNVELESRRSSSLSSSRRHSLSMSFSLPRHFDDIIDCDAVSEAGDIGDRALSSRSHFSLENLSQNRAVVPLQDNNDSTRISPSNLDNVCLDVDAALRSGEKKGVSCFLSCYASFGASV